MEKRQLTKKIYRVILGDRDFYIYAHTKQGAVRDVLDYLKEGALCRQATGEDMYNLGARLGSVLGSPLDGDSDPRQIGLELDAVYVGEQPAVTSLPEAEGGFVDTEAARDADTANDDLPY